MAENAGLLCRSWNNPGCWDTAPPGGGGHHWHGWDLRDLHATKENGYLLYFSNTITVHLQLPISSSPSMVLKELSRKPSLPVPHSLPCRDFYTLSCKEWRWGHRAPSGSNGAASALVLTVMQSRSVLRVLVPRRHKGREGHHQVTLFAKEFLHRSFPQQSSQRTTKTWKLRSVKTAWTMRVQFLQHFPSEFYKNYYNFLFSDNCIMKTVPTRHFPCLWSWKWDFSAAGGHRLSMHINVAVLKSSEWKYSWKLRDIIKRVRIRYA